MNVHVSEKLNKKYLDKGHLWPFLFALFILGFQHYLIQKIPTTIQSNVVGIKYVIDSDTFNSRPQATVSAKDFCEKWTGQASHLVDCRTALSIENLKVMKSDSADQTLMLAQTQASENLEWYKKLRSEIEIKAKDRPILASLISSMNAKIEASEKFQTKSSNQESFNSYQETFQWLLLLNGSGYDSAKDQFRQKRWDIARLNDSSEKLMKRGEEQESTLKLLAQIILLCSAIVLAIGYWRAQWSGLICIGTYLCLSTLGLTIAADAAMLFGQNNLYYSLNPLGNQLNRQLEIQLLGFFLLAAILTLKPWLHNLTSIILKFQLLAVWLVAILVVAAYRLQSPALGAETLKLGLAVLAASLMTDQGRVLHLVKKFAPDVLQKGIKIFLTKSETSGNSLSANRQVLGHISKPLINFTAFGFIALTVVSIVFKDLGGALIAALVLITALFLVFGAKPAILSLSAMGLMGALISQTEKVQSRIQLMIDPMTASVSDFARLIAFTEASKPSGFGVGQIEWCSQEGTCLPLQVLSDYVPTLINGLWGPDFTKFFFIFLIVFFLMMASLACWRFLTGNSGNRFVAMTAFFLFIASLFQTVVTFFGNWRLIPLTGLGTPLLSIGLSAMLAPTLAIALVLVCNERTKETP